MEKEVHPGSWLGDGVEEFKKLPTWGKIGVGGAFAVVAYLGYRAYVASHSSTTSGSTAGTTGTGGILSGGAVTSGQDTTAGGLQSPFAQVPSGPGASSVPVLPPGLQPVFDGVGNLIGWQPTTTTTPGTPPPTPPPPPQTGEKPSLIEYIRQAFSQPGVASYDQSHSGIPVRSAPGAGNNVIGTLAFGSPIDLTGAQTVSGTSNIGGKQGTSIWYKLPSGGYVSQYDITPTIQPHYNQTQPPPQPKV